MERAVLSLLRDHGHVTISRELVEPHDHSIEPDGGVGCDLNGPRIAKRPQGEGAVRRIDAIDPTGDRDLLSVESRWNLECCSEHKIQYRAHGRLLLLPPSIPT